MFRVSIHKMHFENRLISAKDRRNMQFLHLIFKIEWFCWQHVKSGPCFKNRFQKNIYLSHPFALCCLSSKRPSQIPRRGLLRRRLSRRIWANILSLKACTQVLFLFRIRHTIRLSAFCSRQTDNNPFQSRKAFYKTLLCRRSPRVRYSLRLLRNILAVNADGYLQGIYPVVINKLCRKNNVLVILSAA